MYATPKEVSQARRLDHRAMIVSEHRMDRLASVSVMPNNHKVARREKLQGGL